MPGAFALGIDDLAANEEAFYLLASFENEFIARQKGGKLYTHFWGKIIGKLIELFKLTFATEEDKKAVRKMLCYIFLSKTDNLSG